MAATWETSKERALLSLRCKILGGQPHTHYDDAARVAVECFEVHDEEI